jgi:hypothetical protein
MRRARALSAMVYSDEYTDFRNNINIIVLRAVQKH